MSSHTYKTIEITGSSTAGLQPAVEGAVSAIKGGAGAVKGGLKKLFGKKSPSKGDGEESTER